MFYRRGFVLAFVSSLGLSLMVFVAAMLLGPLLLQSLGPGIGRFIIATAAFLSRVFLARFVSVEMWEKRAPLGRVVGNIVPGCCLGWALIGGTFGLLSGVGSTDFDSVLIGFLCNLIVVAVASFAGCLLARTTELGPALGPGAQYRT